MLSLQNPVPNSPHGLCGRKAILNWNLAKYHSVTTRMHSAEKPKQPEVVSEASTGGGVVPSDFSLILIHFKFNYRSVCSISPSNY